MIVDDDPMNLDALERVLRADYELVRASNTDEALGILREQGRYIDLILADKQMPGRSGVALMEDAKELSAAMRIILTAYPDTTDLLEAINRGEVYRYVTKPWSPEELKTVIAQALEHYQLGRDNAELIAELKRKNAELKAMATRVADAYLKRIDAQGGGSGELPQGQLALRDLMAAAAYPTVKSAAEGLEQTLSRAEERLREQTTSSETEYVTAVVRDCLAHTRRILSAVKEIDELGD